MINIRDIDKSRLERIVDLLAIGLTEREKYARWEAQAILASIHELSQPQIERKPR